MINVTRDFTGHLIILIFIEYVLFTRYNNSNILVIGEGSNLSNREREADLVDLELVLNLKTRVEEERSIKEIERP